MHIGVTRRLLGEYLAAVGSGSPVKSVLNPRQVESFRGTWRAVMRLLAGKLYARYVAAERAHLLSIKLTHQRGNDRIFGSPKNNHGCGGFGGRNASVSERLHPALGIYRFFVRRLLYLSPNVKFIVSAAA